jgi:hypothetical protein
MAPGVSAALKGLVKEWREELEQSLRTLDASLK